MRSGLSTKRALLVGAGGLGGPSLLGLAAAGVGSVVLVDHDTIDATNLGRQLLFGDDDVGRPKVERLAAAVSQRFPGITILAEMKRFDATAASLLDGVDVVLDATDHFPTRFLLNDLCASRGVPLVHGAALQWLGQLLVLRPGVTACLRCVFEGEPTFAGPTCAEAGVVSPLVGVIGGWMADAAVQLLTAPEQCGSGLRVLDGWTGRERFARVDRDPRCPVCASP